MMKWIPEHARWADRMQEVLHAHIEPVSNDSGLDFEEIVEELGNFFGQAMGQEPIKPGPPSGAADQPDVGGEQFGDGSAVSLAHLSLSGKRLTLTVNSRARLDKARPLIESVLSPLIGAGEMNVHSIEQIVREADDDERPGERELPDEVSEKMRNEYLDQYYRKVVDEQVPMLGGRTPRDAARDAPGRELLVELLKHYENAQTRAGFSYDFGWMWRELGIEHLRK
jgi:hypothetical protein